MKNKVTLADIIINIFACVGLFEFMTVIFAIIMTNLGIKSLSGIASIIVLTVIFILSILSVIVIDFLSQNKRR